MFSPRDFQDAGVRALALWAAADQAGRSK